MKPGNPKLEKQMRTTNPDQMAGESLATDDFVAKGLLLLLLCSVYWKLAIIWLTKDLRGEPPFLPVSSSQVETGGRIMTKLRKK